MSRRTISTALFAMLAFAILATAQSTTQPAQYAAPGIVPLGGGSRAPRPPATAPTTAPADDVEGKVFQIIATVFEMDK